MALAESMQRGADGILAGKQRRRRKQRKRITLHPGASGENRNLWRANTERQQREKERREGQILLWREWSDGGCCGAGRGARASAGDVT